MAGDDTRDVARVLGDLWDHILSLEERNEQPEEVVVPEQVGEDLETSDTTTPDTRTGSDKYLTYEQDTYDFHEYE